MPHEAAKWVTKFRDYQKYTPITREFRELSHHRSAPNRRTEKGTGGMASATSCNWSASVLFLGGQEHFIWIYGSWTVPHVYPTPGPSGLDQGLLRRSVTHLAAAGHRLGPVVNRATSRGRAPGPTRAQLSAAAGRTIPDVATPGLHVLFAGINPGLYSAATGHHFARPGNRFWPALHRSGFTDRLLGPSEQDQLLGLGLGITNIVARATARADELGPDELIAGREILAAKVATLHPRRLAVAGVTAYRTAFGKAGAIVGPQELAIGQTQVWVLPNPSGLNALWTTPKLIEAFRDLRLHVEGTHTPI
jgi:double-stranded uracil-DNA glycosylase